MESVEPQASPGEPLPEPRVSTRAAIVNHGRQAGSLTRWMVIAGWESFIFGPDALDLSDLSRDPRATLVKANPLRRVWRVTCPQRTLYVKEYSHPSVRDAVRHLLRGPEARSEWLAGRIAERRGVPCIRFIACGTARRRSFLVSDAAAGAQTLRDAWLNAQRLTDQPARRKRVNALLHAAARLLARSHDSGFLHGDDHPRNILIVPGSNGPCSAIYADIAGARTKGAVSDGDAAGSLAQLNQWFRRRSPRLLRLRFLRIYCLERTRLQPTSGHPAKPGAGGEQSAIRNPRSAIQVPAARRMMRCLAPQASNAVHRQAARLWNKRDRRIHANNRYFATLRLAGGGRAHVTLRFRQRDLFPAPSMPDRTPDQWRTLLDDTTRGAHPPNVRCITHQPTTFTDRLRWRLGASSVQRAYFLAHRLRNRDLPCRWPIALRSFPHRTGGELWLDAEPETRALTDHLQQISADLPARRRTMTALAEFVTLLADRGASIAPIPRRDRKGADPSNPTWRLGVVPDTATVIIDWPAGVALGNRDPQRNAFLTTITLYQHLRSTDALRRTDAARYLKKLAPPDWKLMWRRIRDSSRRINHDS